MDWLLRKTDDPDPGAVDHLVSSEELRWIELFRALQPTDRSAILQVTRSLADFSIGLRTLHDEQHTYTAEA